MHWAVRWARSSTRLAFSFECSILVGARPSRPSEAQADKKAYQDLMRHTVESQQLLRLMQGNVIRLTPLGLSGNKGGDTRGSDQWHGERDKARGKSDTTREAFGVGYSWEISTEAGLTFLAKCVILSPGTFLNGRIHVGMNTFVGGRAGEISAPHLSEVLADLGFELKRLKTGTSPRLARRSIDFSKLTPQAGDVPPPFFSFSSGGRESNKSSVTSAGPILPLTTYFAKTSTGLPSLLEGSRV